MIRVLVIITPQMYRQAIALSIRRQRPGADVRIAPPEGSTGELADVRPHLLVHDDEGLGSEALGGVPYLIEVQYSDGMNARVSANGELSNVRDVSTEDLLEVVDLAIALADRG